MFKLGEVVMFIGPGKFSGENCQITSGLQNGTVRDAVNGLAIGPIDYYMIKFENDPTPQKYAARPQHLQKLPPHDERGSWDTSVWKPEALKA